MKATTRCAEEIEFVPGLQPAGRLRGVLVERGADERSLRLGSVCRVLGLHPVLPNKVGGLLGPGQSLTGTRFPSSAAPRLKAPRSHSEECPGLGSLK